MPTPDMRKPRLTGNHDAAQNQKQHGQFTTIVREIAAILAIGLMVGTMFWSAVFGAADDLASGPMVPVHVAEVQHGR